MLSWRDIVVHCLSKSFPPEVLIIIFSHLKREHISYLAEESRDYHVDRMPRVEGSYLIIKVTHDYEEEACIYSETIDELTDKWEIIDPKGKEYSYMECWIWDRFNYPYMNFIYAFNRGRIFLKFLKGYEWYDLDSADNIVDKLTDYKNIP